MDSNTTLHAHKKPSQEKEAVFIESSERAGKTIRIKLLSNVGNNICWLCSTAALATYLICFFTIDSIADYYDQGVVMGLVDLFTSYGLVISLAFFAITNRAREWYILLYECSREIIQCETPELPRALIATVLNIILMLVFSVLIYLLGSLYIPFLRALFL